MGSHPSGVRGQADLIATSDGGSTWVKQTLPSGIWDLQDVSFFDAQHGFAAGEGCGAGGCSVLISTADGGLHWSSMNAPQPNYGTKLTKVQFADASHGWVLAPQTLYCGPACAYIGGSSHWTELYRTTDGGATWNTHGGQFSATAISFVDPSNGWAVAGGIFTTHDSGSTWTQQR